MNVGAALVAAAVCWIAAMWLRRMPRVWLVLTTTGSAAVVIAAAGVMHGGQAWEWLSSFLLGGERVHLRLDPLSGWFLILVGVIGGVAGIYAHGYWPDHHHASAARGRGWWNGMVLGMMLLLLCYNGLHFLVAWEAFAVCGYFLITLERRKRAVRSAGWLYLAASHTGTACLFAFFASLAARTGSWDLAALHGRADLAPWFWLALAGFGLKAGFFPLHVWLPSAHANAPSHVSAMMSGVAIKMGVYGLMRFSGAMPVPVAAGWVIMALGAVTALLGIAFAMGQNDCKRLLAYCSVENVGIILTGLGAAMLARAAGGAGWGLLVMAGALWHVWNHGLFKALMFFAAGSVVHATGTREMSRMGGLWRTMPWTAVAFATGAAAVAALPPLNGLVSEWLIGRGLLEAVALRETAGWMAAPAMILLGTAGALVLATFAKAGAVMFLGAPRTQAARTAQECGVAMTGPMLALAALCLLAGVAPVWIWPWVSRAAAAWHPAWAVPVQPASLGALGRFHLLLVPAILAAVSLLALRVRATGLRRGITWDCGYAQPSARMQYSSGSFAATISGWFGWVLRPACWWRRARGFFPLESLRVERVPETLLEHFLQPAGVQVMRVSTAVRRLQHGRLSAYILYVAVGLAVLAGFVWIESLP